MLSLEVGESIGNLW